MGVDGGCTVSVQSGRAIVLEHDSEILPASQKTKTGWLVGNWILTSSRPKRAKTGG